MNKDIGPEPKGILHAEPSAVFNCKCISPARADPLALTIRVGDRDVETPYRLVAQPRHSIVSRL